MGQLSNTINDLPPHPENIFTRYENLGHRTTKEHLKAYKDVMNMHRI